MTTAPKPAAPATPAPTGFWRLAIIFSFIINLILVLVLVGAVVFIFPIRNAIAVPLIGGLYDNFILMNEATIRADVPVNDRIQVVDTIIVSDTLPVVFDLPLETDTTVTLVESTPIQGATIFLNGQPLPINIVLPQGTPLKIRLGLTVPVSQTVPVILNVPVNLDVPVKLNVGVNIPLKQTELNVPFTNLAEIVKPYNDLLNQTPASIEQLLGQ